ncbi:hypothetical protein F5Y11DRAFT_347829 [Daldinia sp. FL1419]|nr:hypothetical protein F5Y11DRAFT_347829 [Daldinia sp. FL1419]
MQECLHPRPCDDEVFQIDAYRPKLEDEGIGFPYELDTATAGDTPQHRRLQILHGTLALTRSIAEGLPLKLSIVGLFVVFMWVFWGREKDLGEREYLDFMLCFPHGQ